MDKITPDRSPTAEQAVLALRRLNSALTVSNRIVGARLDIRDGDLVVLDALHQDGPQTPTELAHHTKTHIATMTGILTRLERGGWVERHRNEDDGRSARIHAAGVGRLGDTYARASERLAGLLVSWSPDQLQALTRFLSNASAIIVASAEEIHQESRDMDS